MLGGPLSRRWAVHTSGCIHPKEWTSRPLGLRGFVFDAASARAERVQKRCHRLQFVRAQPNGVRQAYGGYSGQTLFDLLEKLRGGSLERRIKIPHVELLTRQLSGVLAGVCEEQKLTTVHGLKFPLPLGEGRVRAQDLTKPVTLTRRVSLYRGFARRRANPSPRVPAASGERRPL